MARRADHDRRPWRPRLVRAGVLLAILVLAGLGAAGIEWLRGSWATRYSATAEVTMPESWRRGSVDRRGPAMAIDSDGVADEILRDAPATDRRDLHVTFDRPRDNTIRIAVTLTDVTPESAIRRVNEVVAGYSAELHKRALAGLLQRAAEIGVVDQRVRREVQGIQEELDRVIRRTVSEAAQANVTLPSDPTKPVSARSGSAVVANPDSGPARAGSGSGDARPGSEPATGSENPEWIAAQRRLGQLEQHRAYLLRDRTPVHPEVLQVETQISEAKRSLAAIAPRLPGASSPGPQEPPAPTAGAPVAASETPKKAPTAADSPSPQLAELSQAIQRQRERMDRVAQDLEQTTKLDLQAADALVRGDNLQLRLADRAEPIAVRLEWGDMLLVGLAAGLMAAAGFGMIWTGATLDAPLTDRRDVEQCLAVPVVGTIALNPGAGRAALGPIVHPRRRSPYVVGGLAILAVYLVFLLHPFLAR